MSDFVQKVKEFNEIAGNFEQFSSRKAGMYIGLILEEVREIVTSMPQGDLGNLIVALDYYSRRFKSGEFDSLVEQIDRLNAAKEAADVAVVSIGFGISIGYDMDGVTLEVADSNLSKFEVDQTSGKRVVLKDETGKVMKPPSYHPPDLRRFER